MGLAVVAAVAVASTLPSATYYAQAIVAVADPTSPLSIFLPKTAAEVAVSKPVMRRAAESLIETGFPTEKPGLLDRVAVAAGIGGAKAAGKADALAAGLSRVASSQPGALPGSIEISAAADDAEQSARIAGAVADAFIADQEETIAKARRSRDIETAKKLERLKAEAAAARNRVASLGGFEADPSQARAAAATQTATAKARVDTIRAILGSGSPPMSDRRDVPSAIEALQATYVDLSRQLAKARETFGDRHTTIIGLQAELKRAATSLTAEWRRFGKLAEGELAAARERENALRKAEGPTDAGRRAALEEARHNIQIADDAIARAQARQSEITPDERGYRLISRPAIPTKPAGLSLLLRIVLGLLTGALVFFVSRTSPAIRLASAFRSSTAEPSSVSQRHSGSDLGEEAQPKARAPFMKNVSPAAVAIADPDSDPNEDLVHAMYDLLPELEAIAPAFGPIPTILVAANEAGVTTTRVALALARAVAESNHRVLLVEAACPQPALAASASDDHHPILVDLFGCLRVALRAETDEGLLYLAPSLKQGTRIASALAQGNETPIIDDVGEEFDLIVIDGSQAEACVAEGWGADAYLRVGRFESRRDDALLAQTFGVPQDMVLGTVVASGLRKPSRRPASPAPRLGTAQMRPSPKGPARGNAPATRNASTNTMVNRRRFERR